MLYEINTRQQHEKIINDMLKKGYTFPNGGKGWDFETAKSVYHGNSKLLLHCFYNDITKKKEMKYITRSVYLSYPQFSLKTYEKELVKQ